MGHPVEIHTITTATLKLSGENIHSKVISHKQTLMSLSVQQAEYGVSQTEYLYLLFVAVEYSYCDAKQLLEEQYVNI